MMKNHITPFFSIRQDPARRFPMQRYQISSGKLHHSYHIKKTEKSLHSLRNCEGEPTSGNDTFEDGGLKLDRASFKHEIPHLLDRPFGQAVGESIDVGDVQHHGFNGMFPMLVDPLLMGIHWESDDVGGGQHARLHPAFQGVASSLGESRVSGIKAEARGKEIARTPGERLFEGESGAIGPLLWRIARSTMEVESEITEELELRAARLSVLQINVQRPTSSHVGQTADQVHGQLATSPALFMCCFAFAAIRNVDVHVEIELGRSIPDPGPRVVSHVGLEQYFPGHVAESFSAHVFLADSGVDSSMSKLQPRRRIDEWASRISTIILVIRNIRERPGGGPFKTVW